MDDVGMKLTRNGENDRVAWAAIDDVSWRVPAALQDGSHKPLTLLQKGGPGVRSRCSAAVVS